MSTQQSKAKDIELKLSQAGEARSKARSTHLLLNFELLHLENEIQQNKNTINELVKEEQRLLKSNQEASQQLKRIHNYFDYLCPMQVDRKGEWMQNLRGELNSLDFTLEEYEEEPSRSVDSFTQVSHR